MSDIHTTPLAIRLLQILNISTASTLTGITLSTSFLLVPRLLESPTPLLLQQWHHTYIWARTRLAPLSALNGAISLYLAYVTRNALKTSPLSKSTGYVISGICAIGLIPYTLLVIDPTNRKLEAKVEETSALKRTDTIVEVGLGAETAHALLDRWGVLNLGRAALGAVSALVGTWVTVM